MPVITTKDFVAIPIPHWIAQQLLTARTDRLTALAKLQHPTAGTTAHDIETAMSLLADAESRLCSAAGVIAGSLHASTVELQ